MEFPIWTVIDMFYQYLPHCLLLCLLPPLFLFTQYSLSPTLCAMFVWHVCVATPYGDDWDFVIGSDGTFVIHMLASSCCCWGLQDCRGKHLLLTSSLGGSFVCHSTLTPEPATTSCLLHCTLMPPRLSNSPVTPSPPPPHSCNNYHEREIWKDQHTEQ